MCNNIDGQKKAKQGVNWKYYYYYNSTGENYWEDERLMQGVNE